MKIKPQYQLVLSLFLLLHLNSFSQVKIEDFFDNSIGKENLPLNNGAFYFNTFKTLTTHQFYQTNKYVLGNVTYDNQFYNTVNLKYDNYKDILIFKPYGESENFGIILVPNEISKFQINNKNFINLGLITKDSLKNVSGYYEENLNAKNFTFYIKHKKDRREFIKNQIIYNDFEIYNEFLILTNKTYNSIKSKKDIINLFPTYKKEISTFFTENSKLAKDNKTAFYEKIFRFINNLNPIN